MRIAFATLGCKINQYESELLRQDFRTQGDSIVPFDGEADVYIINTCSVTAKSDTQARQLIRSAIRRGRGAKIVVTGCYAETRPAEIMAIPGVDLVIGNSLKSAIPSQVASAFSGRENDVPENGRTLSPRSLQGRTRAFLKIQDGCNNRCTYCIVPSARGKSRSALPDQVTGEFDGLVERGCAEIVLTGIHIGTYGIDLPKPTNLTGLITSIAARRKGSRIRLSSIEPREITDGMISLLGKGLCRHLHVPLQSGDDGILGKMGRDYTSGFYLQLLQRISEQVPGVALGADIMVGFPGEREMDFQNTMSLVAQSPLTHFHVFSYSPRPGTAAASMKDQVSDQVKKERNEALRRVGEEKNLAFRKSFCGSVLNVVIEDKVHPTNGLLSGLTDNYLRVSVKGAKSLHIGQEIQVRLEEVNKSENIATIL